MDVVFGLIPMMLVFGFLVVLVFIWMAKSGQFDDLDGAANSIFMDDEYEEDLPDQQQEKGLTKDKDAI
jgi:cbb3-type cytochrome oxidase maturation protein